MHGAEARGKSKDRDTIQWLLVQKGYPTLILRHSVFLYVDFHCHSSPRSMITPSRGGLITNSERVLFL